jgi:hypothetical protein
VEAAPRQRQREERWIGPAGFDGPVGRFGPAKRKRPDSLDRSTGPKEKRGHVIGLVGRKIRD